MATSLWEFMRRHRSRIAAGATIVGGVYVAKKIWESEVLAGIFESLQAQAEKYHISEGSGSAHSPEIVRAFDGSLSLARRHFIFDAHQESCDKTLLQIIPTIQEMIRKRFNAEELVERLKADRGEMSADDKIALWETLKLRSIGRILAVAYAYPLLVVAFKSQKAILCAEICDQMEQVQREKNAISGEGGLQSLTSRAAQYLSSFLWESPEGTHSNAGGSEGTTLDVQTQQLFSNCTCYLTSDGLEQLFLIIEANTQELFGTIPLTQNLTAQDIRKLFAEAKTKLEMSLFAHSGKRLAELVVPTGKPIISSLRGQSSHLQELVSRLEKALQSQRCRFLLSSLSNIYLDSCEEIIQIDGLNSLPLAKQIPPLTDAFGKLARANIDSLLQRILILPTLYQFSLMASRVNESSTLTGE